MTNLFHTSLLNPILKAFRFALFEIKDMGRVKIIFRMFVDEVMLAAGKVGLTGGKVTLRLDKIMLTGCKAYYK